VPLSDCGGLKGLSDLILMKLPKRDAIGHERSMKLMSRAFCDLAVSFAEVDPDAADEAVRRIELMVASEMHSALQRPPDRVTVAQMREVIAQMIGPFRDMTQAARHLIKEAETPKN
jgi:hypothetical protein